MFARVENGVTKFSPKKNKSKLLDQKQQFSMGIFFAAEQLTFLGGGYNFKTG